jgi:hypothetical protein
MEMTMRLRKLAFFALFLLTTSFVFGQTQPTETAADKEKKKKEFDERVVQMLDQAVAEANGLRLPGNRAIVYAVAGDLYWKFDDKRARELFRTAATDIVAQNFEWEKQRLESAEPVTLEPFDPFDVRPQVMPLIGKRDAELALELLVATRPAKLSEAIASGTTDQMLTGRVTQELALEQQFALAAADQDPELAIRLIRDSLAKGVSYSVLPLLQKLFKKDEKKANELGAEVLRRLGETDLAKSMTEMNVALSFLQFGSRPVPANAKEKQFAFTEAQIRELANKVAAALLAPSNNSTQAMSMMSRAIPILEKILPDKVQVLRARQAATQRNLPSDIARMQQQQRMWDPNSTPEQVLAMIPKITNEGERANAYQAVANKIGQITDEARAKRLIDQIPDERARANAREQFETMRLNRLAGTGKLEEARRSIAGLTDRRRKIQSLVNLAQQHQRRNKEEDRETAASLMTEAKALVSEYPEDGDEIDIMMMVVMGYATVEPDTAFRMFEPVVESLNEHTQAMAVLSKYDKRSRDFRKGELVMRMQGAGFGSNLLLFRYMNQMQTLGVKDFERMSALADRFQRADSRMIVKLLVLQAAANAPQNQPPRPVAF